MNTTTVNQRPSQATFTNLDLFSPITPEQAPVFVDVRTPLEFEEVHIPESRNIPLPDLHKFVEEIQHLSQKQPIVLVCRTQNRVKIAYEYLTNNSVINCQILEGGITDWVKSGKPAIRGRKSISLEGQVRAIAGSLILLGVGLGVTMNLWFLLIPALVGVGLFHAGLTDSCLMGMLLSKLPINRIRTSSSSSGIQGGPS